MNATVLNLLLAATAVSAPIWILQRRARNRPWMARWLLCLCLLLLPSLLAKLFAPAEWMDVRTMPTPFWYLTALPFLLAMAALGGSLLALAVAALGAMARGFVGSARRPDEGNDASTPTFHQRINPHDWKNDWKYRFYRDDD